MERHYRAQVQDSATASSSTGAVGNTVDQGTFVTFAPESRVPMREPWNIGTRHHHLHGNAVDQTTDNDWYYPIDVVTEEESSGTLLFGATFDAAEESPETENLQAAIARCLQNS